MTRAIAFLTNPTSGRHRGRKARDLAVPVLDHAGHAVRRLEGRDAVEAAALAREALAEGCDTLVVCGGDGLVHLGAQIVAGTSTPLGIVPCGTGNDVARYLDLPRRDPAAAAARIAARIAGGHSRKLDLARVDGPAGETWFVTVLAAGFDAIVNERANRMTWPKGQMRYNLATLLELRTFAPLHYEIELDGVPLEADAMLCAVGNGPSFGGGLRITEGALLDDGMLDVVVIRPMSKLDLVRVYPKLFSGKVQDVPQYEHHRVRRVRVSCPGIVAYADGERMGPLPLTVEAVPGALEVLA